MQKDAEGGLPAHPDGARRNFFSLTEGRPGFPRSVTEPLAARARASPRPRLALHRPRALTFQSSSASASAFASAPGTHSD